MNQAFSENVAARADMLAMLCISLRLPTREVAEALADGSFRYDMHAIGNELGYNMANVDELLGSYERPFDGTTNDSTDATDILHAIRRDYTQLFANPTELSVSPYESVFKLAESGKRTQPVLYISDAAQKVSTLYREAGYAPSREYRDSADNIVIELFFMRELELRIMRGEGGKAQLATFITEHFGTWTPQFFEKAARAAREPFYQAVCAMGTLLAYDYTSLDLSSM